MNSKIITVGEDGRHLMRLFSTTIGDRDKLAIKTAQMRSELPGLTLESGWEPKKKTADTPVQVTIHMPAGEGGAINRPAWKELLGTIGMRLA